MEHTPSGIIGNTKLIAFLKFIDEYYMDYEDKETPTLTKHIINGYITYKLS